MAASSMRKTLPQAAPLQPPCNGQTGSQGAFAFDSPSLWISALYDAARAAVEAYGGQDALAADMGVSRQILNMRLNRAQDSRGDLQRLHVDAIGHAFAGETGRAAREAFMLSLAESCGFKVQPAAPPTDAEMLRALASEMTDKQKRRVEQERGWPKGWLDR